MRLYENEMKGILGGEETKMIPLLVLLGLFLSQLSDTIPVPWRR